MGLIVRVDETNQKNFQTWTDIEKVPFTILAFHLNFQCVSSRKNGTKCKKYRNKFRRMQPNLAFADLYPPLFHYSLIWHLQTSIHHYFTILVLSMQSMGCHQSTIDMRSWKQKRGKKCDKLLVTAISPQNIKLLQIQMLLHRS